MVESVKTVSDPRSPMSGGISKVDNTVVKSRTQVHADSNGDDRSFKIKLPYLGKLRR